MKSKIAKALLAAGTAACTIAGYTACSRKKNSARKFAGKRQKRSTAKK